MRKGLDIAESALDEQYTINSATLLKTQITSSLGPTVRGIPWARTQPSQVVFSCF